MTRKIIAGMLIGVSAIMLGLSMAGIILIWTYKGPLVQVTTARLQAINTELGQAHTALQKAEVELERTLRAVDAAEQSMAALKAEFVQVKELFGGVNGTLETQLLPGLKATRAQIEQAKASLLGLQTSLQNLNSLPGLNLNLPGEQVLTNLITGADTLDTQIAQVESMVKQASTFMGDASYLLGGDFTETKTNLQNFLVVVRDYDQKLTGWQDQLTTLIGALPGWVQGTSLTLTIFLAWFGFSQVGLMLHGLNLWKGKLFPVPLTAE